MIALTQAENAAGDWRLTDCTLYVTKEPCPMCAGAIVHTRLARVVFGTGDPKGGAAGGALNLLQFPTLNHRCAITSGVRLEECRALLQSFFAEQRGARRKTAKIRPTEKRRRRRKGSNSASWNLRRKMPPVCPRPRHAKQKQGILADAPLASQLKYIAELGVA